jgi:hypothetical protein
MAERERAKAAEEVKTECEESLLNLIELGYVTVGLRARAEKTTQFFTSVLKHLQNLQQVQQEIMPFIHDVARQWMDATVSFDTTARQFATSLAGVIDVCTEAGRKIEDIMTYIDPLIDMILGVPAILKVEKFEETKRGEPGE